MQEYSIDGKTYRLPNHLTGFQLEMYVHLVNYKWNVLGIQDPGEYEHPKKKGTFLKYDTMFPDDVRGEYHPLYRPIVELFKDPRDERYRFKIHEMAIHMASSQVACANLFLPLMVDPDAAAGVLSSVKTDLVRIDTEHLDSGFAIEFWNDFDVNPRPGKGLLSDHTPRAGTDCDIAIVYRDPDDVLCLWMIEHKLTEQEFTTCGGYRSKRNKDKSRCLSLTPILQDPDLCHYHGDCGYEYWNITLANPEWFPLREHTDGPCPFKGGLNQLWRNQLLAAAIEKSSDWPYQKVFFSVCHHPKNHALQKSIDAFSELLGDKSRFFSFTSEPLINKARASKEPTLCKWADWYSNLYFF